MSAQLTRKEFVRLASIAGVSLINGALLRGSALKKFSYPDFPRNSPEYIDSDNPSYDAIRQGFNKRITHSPAVIALCSSTQDVADAVKYAHQKNLDTTIKSGGHNFEGYSSNDGGLVIDLSRMNAVQFQKNGDVEIGPGCHLSSVYDMLLPKKRLIPAGSCGSVGIGGLALGGGYGFFSRAWGLTCDNLTDATVVDGGGTIHSASDDPDLLWALRGGGTGGLCVATNLRFQTHPAPATFTSHRLKSHNLSPENAASILQTWFEATSRLQVQCFSAFVLNGKTLNILLTNFGDSGDVLQSAIAILQSEMQAHATSQTLPIGRALRQYYGRKGPLYFKNASAGLYKSFEDIRNVLPHILKISMNTPGMIYQINTLGGNISNESFATASCFPHRAYSYLAELQTYWDSPSSAPRLLDRFQAVQSLFYQNGIRAQYSNYCSQEFQDWETAYYGTNYARLKLVKKKYDPNNLLRHPQSIRL